MAQRTKPAPARLALHSIDRRDAQPTGRFANESKYAPRRSRRDRAIETTASKIVSSRHAILKQSAFQIALPQAFTLGRADAESIAQIVVEAAIAGIDGFERGSQERGLHGSEHLPHVIGQVAADGWIAAIEAVGQQIVFRDHVVI